MKFTIRDREIYIGLVRGKPKFMFHIHQNWWWIRLLRFQLEVMRDIKGVSNGSK